MNEIFENNLMLIEDRNELAFYDSETLVMRVTRKDGSQFFVFFDIDDFDIVSKYKWSVVPDHNTFYALDRDVNPNGVETMIRMHRLVMYREKIFESDRTEMIDHINHNGLDNRKINLRKVDNRQNQWNVSQISRNTTGVIGVSYSRSSNSFNVSIRVPDGRYNKSFNIDKYGYEQAKNLAIEQRKQWEKMFR